MLVESLRCCCGTTRCGRSEVRPNFRELRLAEVQLPRIPLQRRWVHEVARGSNHPLRCYPCKDLRLSRSYSRWDVALARTESSLAVTQGDVVAMYGLHLVEAASAIYVIPAGSVARVDKVVACAGVDLVGAFVGVDSVVAAAAFDCVVPDASVEVVILGATLQVVVPFESAESIVLGGASESIV